MNIKLKQLSTDMVNPEYDMLQQLPDKENGFSNPAYNITYDEYKKWLIKEDGYSRGENLPEEYVPCTTFFLYIDNIPVGYGRVRHSSNERLEKIIGAGNLGYGIAKNYRGKGYGKILFGELLKECKKIGYDKIKLFPLKTNTATINIMNYYGGKIIGDFKGEKHIIEIPLANELRYEQITSDNLEIACNIQNTIFPEEDARQNFVEQINQDPYRKEQYYQIVYLNNTPIAITGIYSYHEYPENAWLGWFGVLKEYRNKGYGGAILDTTIKLAKDKGYTKFRLYTDEFATDAHRLYESRGLIKELYDNPDDKDEFFDAEVYIYSKSLTNDPIDMWNNKIIGLKEQGEKENGIIPESNRWE